MKDTHAALSSKLFTNIYKIKSSPLENSIFPRFYLKNKLTLSFD